MYWVTICLSSSSFSSLSTKSTWLTTPKMPYRRRERSRRNTTMLLSRKSTLLRQTRPNSPANHRGLKRRPKLGSTLAFIKCLNVSQSWSDSYLNWMGWCRLTDMTGMCCGPTRKAKIIFTSGWIPIRRSITFLWRLSSHARIEWQ